MIAPRRIPVGTARLHPALARVGKLSVFRQLMMATALPPGKAFITGRKHDFAIAIGSDQHRAAGRDGLSSCSTAA